MFRYHVRAAFLALASLICLSASLHAGTFSTTNITGDSDVGISTAKTYTHAVDLQGAVASINGVPFTGVSGTNPGNATFATSNYSHTFPGPAATTAIGNIGTLLQNFVYYGAGANVSENVTIYGLTPGNTYSTRFYTDVFGPVGGRLQNVTSNADATVYDGNIGPRFLNYTFVATGHANTVSFDAQVDAASFHNYGFTNEVVALALTSVSSNATRYVTDLYNTGVSNTGAPLANNVADPHYTVTGPQASIFAPQATVQANNGAWSANGLDSKWIGVTASGGDNVASGTYTYQTTFTLPSGTVPSTAQLSGVWWADNDGAGLQILLNGVNTGVSTSAPFNSATGTPFNILDGMNNAHFLQGINTLTFQVPNPGGANPSGLRIGNLTAFASTPEPASVALWSLLGMAGAAYAWRVRRRGKIT